MEIREDCFAYNEKTKECDALKELYCAKENCKFYKSCEEISQKYIENCIKSYRYKHQNDKEV